jgi:hypothetical protein
LRVYSQLTAILLGAALLAPTASSAQALGAEVDGYIAGGLAISARDLGLITVADATSQIQFTNKLDSGPFGAIGIIAPLPTRRASLRVSLSYAQRSVTTIPALCDGFLPCSDIEAGTADATLLAASAGILLHSASQTETMRPYFLTALTVRGYRFDDSCTAATITCDAIQTFLSDQFKPQLSIGLGSFIGTGDVEIMLEAVAHLGTFGASGALARGETQNDFQFSAGLSFPLISR